MESEVGWSSSVGEVASSCLMFVGEAITLCIGSPEKIMKQRLVISLDMLDRRKK